MSIHRITCGVCGKAADFTQEVEETWFPYAFQGDKDVSPACPDHPGHWVGIGTEPMGYWEVDAPMPK